MELICEVCDRPFQQTNKYRVSKTCSQECRYELSARSNREKSGARVSAVCQGCGQGFENSVAKPKKFCSRECFDSSRAEASRVRKTCVQCGQEFSSFKRTDQLYCSPRCRNQHVAAQRTINYPRCRSCGASTESYNRVYCRDHTVPGGPKLQPRLEAICVGCGEPFSRPAGYSGKMKYCSNACSHRQVKKVRDKFIADLPEGAVVFHSGWEIRFWAACLRFDIPIRSYDGLDIQTPLGIYRPDFIVSDGDVELVVDIKGWFRPECKEKWAAAIHQGHFVRILPKNQLETMESSGREIAIKTLFQRMDDVPYA